MHCMMRNETTFGPVGCCQCGYRSVCPATQRAAGMMPQPSPWPSPWVPEPALIPYPGTHLTVWTTHWTGRETFQ